MNRKFIPLILFITQLYSCNVTQHYIKKAEKNYTKWGSDSQLISTDSASVFWRKVGEGNKKLLLIHGFGPVPQIQWMELVEELYGEYTIYIPDLLYFGKSTSNIDCYDPRFLARQITQTFSTFGEDQYYIAGVSYGGLVASLIANQHKKNVSGLILMDALSKHMDRAYADSLALTMGYEKLGQLLVPENGKQLKALFKLTFYKPPGYPAFTLNKPAVQLYGNQRIEKQNLLGYLYQNEKQIKTWKLTYEGPVVIIWGKQDLLIPLENAFLIKQQYEDSYLEIIDKGAHVVNMENANEVAAIIRSFTHKQ